MNAVAAAEPNKKQGLMPVSNVSWKLTPIALIIIVGVRGRKI